MAECSTCSAARKKKQCTADDPQGTGPQTYVSSSNLTQAQMDQQGADFQQGITPQMRSAMDAVDNANKPWEIFNDLFGAAASPEAGGDERPGYR